MSDVKNYDPFDPVKLDREKRREGKEEREEEREREREEREREEEEDGGSSEELEITGVGFAGEFVCLFFIYFKEFNNSKIKLN